MMVPTADPELRGGKRVDLGLGFQYAFLNGGHQGHRIAAEISRPVYQWLDGPQLETDWLLTVGLQLTF